MAPATSSFLRTPLLYLLLIETCVAFPPYFHDPARLEVGGKKIGDEKRRFAILRTLRLKTQESLA
jgi:hypothetical protein